MAGEYRGIIANSEVNDNFKEMFSEQVLHIAFKRSFVGNVTSTSEFDEVLIRIFENDSSAKSQSYLRGFKSGELGVVYSFGGKTYDFGKEYYANNGELFFTS
jgi:hypothetical protein